jgi:hypothetical protein
MIAGLLGATFSSALASMIGSSRILFAMGQNRVLPKGAWISVQDDLGQPRNAMIVTGVLIFSTMLLRDLNAIAPLVTMFFLVTYAMLNVVVIIEQNLGLISFRPIFTVNKFIPWIGLISSLFAMFIINPSVSLISWALMFVVYAILSRRHLETPFEDIRSGLFSSFSEWAAKHTAGLGHKQERSWKPNILVPTTESMAVQGAYTILKDIAFSKGSATLMGISDNGSGGMLRERLSLIAESFKKAGLFSSVSIMKTNDFAQGVNFGNQALSSAFFKPNIVFLSLLEDVNSIARYSEIMEESNNLELGVIIYAPHGKALLGQRQKINIWLDDRNGNWDLDKGTGNINLSILVGYKLMLNWKAEIRLIQVIHNHENKQKAGKLLNELIDLARMPITDTMILEGQMLDLIPSASRADINIIPLELDLGYDVYQQVVGKARSSCLFIKDGGHENVLA